MEIKYWFEKTFCRKKLFREVAFHEAGHVAFAYLYGYTCGFTELDIDRPGNGRTEFVFGQHRAAVNTIMQQLNDIVNSLTAGEQEIIVRHAHWLSMVFCAGATAEAYFFKPASSEAYNPIVKGPDLEAVTAVNGLLGQIHADPTKETLRKSLCLILNFQGLPAAIEAIAQGILKSPDKRLSQQQIEQILANSNFNDTRNEIIDKAGQICR